MLIFLTVPKICLVIICFLIRILFKLPTTISLPLFLLCISTAFNFTAEELQDVDICTALRAIATLTNSNSPFIMLSSFYTFSIRLHCRGAPRCRYLHVEPGPLRHWRLLRQCRWRGRLRMLRWQLRNAMRDVYGWDFRYIILFHIKVSMK